MRSGELPSCKKCVVDGQDPVPLCLLADPTYPLVPFLMKEYPGGGSNDREKYFNRRLSDARISIENAFGRLKA